VSDQDLRRLLRSPLLLHVVALAYHGRPASALAAPGSLEQRQRWLWQAYVERMFEQRPLDRSCGYTQEQALVWLAWLARALRDRDQSEFHLDRLAPEWLPTPAQQHRARVVTWCALGLPLGLGIGLGFGLMNPAIGLAFGISGGLAFGLAGGLAVAPIAGLILASASAKEVAKPARPSTRPLSTQRAQPVGELAIHARDEQAGPKEGSRRSQIASVAAALGLAGGLGGGLAGGLSIGPAFGLAVALALGLAGGLGLVLAHRQLGGQPVRIEPTEQVRWSWPAMRAGLVRWLAVGLAVALVFGVLFGLAVDLVGGLVSAFVTGLTIALVYGLLAGLSAGLRDERVMPNEGIRRSGQHALVVGLTAGLIAALTAGLGYGWLFGRPGGLAAGLGFGLVAAASVAMVFGGAACVQHYVVRAWLVPAGAAPWRYGRFLGAVTHRLLLRRSGSAYLFVHRLLRDYLADTLRRPG
jgi:eukaryotic-like serine/threonine-protein kinase